MIIHILAGGDDTPVLWPETIEPYYGQPVYRVFWQIRPGTGVSAAEGQPSDLFGLRNMATEAITSPDEPKTKDDCASEMDKSLNLHNIAKRIAENEITPKSSAVLPWILLCVNIIVLGLMYLDGYAHDPMTAMRFGAIVPHRILNGGEYYRLFTAMFVHFGIYHLMMNAVGLLIFGTRVERYVGPVYFLLIYVLSGLCGSAFSLFLTQRYAAGASGAIYGLVGAVFSFTRITRQTMDQLSDYVMLIYILVGMAMGFAAPQIDNFGHIGGLLSGLALGALATKHRFTTRR
jgi:membrane associated rhomboid family serine protease